MEQVVPLITTPLALAALLVLVAFGAYQTSKGRAAGRINDRVFWLVLAFGILGTGSYVAEKFLLVDTVIRGEVRDPQGRPVPNAVIDISGLTRAATSDAGVFEIAVPPSRVQSKYLIYVFANGFKTSPTEVSGPRPDFVSLKFEPDLAASNYVLDHPEVYLSQNFGSPLFTFGFAEKLNFDGRAKMSVGPIKITDPSGGVTNFFQVTYARNGMGGLGTLGTVLLDRDGWGTEFSIMHATGDNGIQSLLTEVAASVSNVPAWFESCWNGDQANSPTVDTLKRFFDSSFFWKPGSYQVEVDYYVEGVVDAHFFTFVLSTATSSKLANMREQLSRCRGTATDLWAQGNNLAYSDGQAQNTVMVSLSPRTKG